MLFEVLFFFYFFHSRDVLYVPIIFVIFSGSECLLHLKQSRLYGTSVCPTAEASDCQHITASK